MSNAIRSAVLHHIVHTRSDTVLSWTLLIATFCVSACTPDATSPTPTPSPTPEGDGSPVATRSCANGRVLHVGYVVDGDTVEVEQEERIRLVGINTPESYPEDDPDCYGPEAKAHTTEVILGRTICLTYDPAVTAQSNNVDVYGRTLGYIFYGDQYALFLNAELIQDGFAYDYPYTEGAWFETYFAVLEDDAEAARAGLWGACW